MGTFDCIICPLAAGYKNAEVLRVGRGKTQENQHFVAVIT
jgi:hypothetical protein